MIFSLLSWIVISALPTALLTEANKDTKHPYKFNDFASKYGQKSEKVKNYEYYRNKHPVFKYNEIVDPRINVHNGSLISMWLTVKTNPIKIDFEQSDSQLWSKETVRVVKDGIDESTLNIGGYNKKCHFKSITPDIFASVSNCNCSWSGMIVITNEVYVLEPLNVDFQNSHPSMRNHHGARTENFTKSQEDFVIEPRSNLDCQPHNTWFDLDSENTVDGGAFYKDSDLYVDDDNAGESIIKKPDIKNTVFLETVADKPKAWNRAKRMVEKQAHESFCGVKSGQAYEDSFGKNDGSAESAPVLNSASGTNHKWWKNLVVELAVFVDQHLWNKFQRAYSHAAYSQLEDFVVTIMHNVQLFYNHPSISPTVQFKIVRYEVFKTQPPELRGLSDAQEYLNAFCEYQYRWRGRNWDHALLLTGVDLTRAGSEWDISGIARVYGVCDPMNACMLSEAMDFRAAFITAHELGHSLGMNHDEPVCSDQYIMSSTLGAGKVMWSSCSVNDLHKYLHKLNNQNRNCMLVESQHAILQVQTAYLPGQRYDIHKQCEMMHGSGFRKAAASTRYDQGICHMVWCQHVNGGRYYTSHPALEGSECEKGRYCISGKCVPITNWQAAVHGGWIAWSVAQCTQCPCTSIRGSLPIVKSTRACTNPEPSNGGNKCQGEDVLGFVCKTGSRCPGDDRAENLVSVKKYLQVRCMKRRDIMKQDQLTGTGTQIMHNVEKACKIFCNVRTGNSALNFRFFGDHLPNGSPCGKDKYCLNGKCLPLICQGSVIASQNTNCDQLPQRCPQNFASSSDQPLATWSTWYHWSGCSASCGLGFRTRNRDCNTTKSSSSQMGAKPHCTGHDGEKISCMGASCAVISENRKEAKFWNPSDEREFGRWSEWSSCSVTCSEGKQKRYRDCSQSKQCPAEKFQDRPCHLEPCTQWGGWGYWSTCGQERNRRRIRLCYGAETCPGSSEQIEYC